MKNKVIASTIVTMGLVGLLLGGCSSSSNSKSKSSSTSTSAKTTKVTAVGSTALQPLVEQAATDYQKDHKDTTLTVQGGGSGTGLSQVQQGAVQIGNSDIFAEQQSGVKAKELVDHQVAVVGMAPVVNKKVDVTNLSMAQLRDIFTGKIKNWKEVGGQDQKITVINRAQGSGTRATFEAAVLKGEKAITSQEQDSNGTVQKLVTSTPGAISYLSFSYIKPDIQAVGIDHVKPTDANVTTNKWKIWSYEHMYTKGQPNKQTAQFLKYMLTTKIQKGLVKNLGYINMQSMKVTKNAQNVVSAK